MSLLGKAAVAMWWNIRPEQRSEFGDWHSHEHFPERMSIPGFRRGSRWTSTLDAEGFFVLYELDHYETLTSKGYLDRLNAPTRWSTKMMPHHLNMVRSQCRVAASFGGGVATSLATIRLSPETAKEDGLKTMLVETLRELASKPGLTGAHLLFTDTPKDERAHDRAADTRVGRRRRLDCSALGLRPRDAARGSLEPVFCTGPSPCRVPREKSTTGRYRLAFTMTPQDAAAT